MGAPANFVINPPDDELFQHDWTDWLPSGDSIASRLWTIDSPHGSPAPTLTNSTSEACRVSGLVHGYIYKLTEKVTTAAGVVGSQSITLRCRN